MIHKDQNILLFLRGNNSEHISASTDEIIYFNYPSVQIVEAILSTTKIVFIGKSQVSSHIINFLKYYISTASNLIIILGINIDNEFCHHKITSCEVSGNECTIKYNGITRVLVEQHNMSSYSETVALDCLNKTICYRPHKLYNKELGELIVSSQTSENCHPHFVDGLVWYDFKPSLPLLFDEFTSIRFNEYKLFIKEFITLLKDIFLNTYFDDHTVDQFLYNLYSKSPYIGYFVNIAMMKLCDSSYDRFDIITLIATQQFTIQSSNEDAVNCLSNIYKLLEMDSYDKLTLSYKSQELSNITNVEIILLVLWNLSDLRRKALSHLKNHSTYANKYYWRTS